MTDKEHKKLKNQLRNLQKLGLPPDQSLLSLLSQKISTKQKTEKLKNFYLS